MPAPYWIDLGDDQTPFPPVELALREPNGLLAVGGSLSPSRLLMAYREGVFPWYSHDQPVLWWSPDPRSVLFPEDLKIARSLRKSIRKSGYAVSFDTAFIEVMKACAEPRPGQDGTWIVPDIIEAYTELHRLGIAHSAETWHEGVLVGGLYGIALGRVFFGESMFSRQTDASKIAFVHLVRHLSAWGFQLVDCQVRTSHLDSLGARVLPRRTFTRMLHELVSVPGKPAPWRVDESLYPFTQAPEDAPPRGEIAAASSRRDR